VLNITLKKNLLLVGGTGTGKTLNVVNQLNNNYYNATYTNLITAFSGRSMSNQI
jgi:dynein heavy chain